MKKLFAILILFSSCSVISPLQKSKYLTVSNLIDAGKYTEAKDVVDGMTNDRDSRKWPKTWYYKGLLCQEAYMEGIKKNDKSLIELYPNQLIAAYGAYNRALMLDRGGRNEKQIAPKLILLANELQKAGEKNFKDKEYEEALKAFEGALKITRISALSLETDTSLIYNTALAAYEAKELDTAIDYLGKLHNQKHSVNVTHLLSDVYLQKGDTTLAENTLYQGAKQFEYNDRLMLLLTELLYKTNNSDIGLKRLNEAIAEKPMSHTLHFTKGLLYQKTNQYQKAIDSYTEANRLAPDELMVYVNIATCYFNIGVEIEEIVMQLTSIRAVEEQKAKSAKAFSQATHWLDMAMSQKSVDQSTLSLINELYRMLGATDRIGNGN
ncbi:MAG: tetratricopeptide repeat protein [Bacteroidales bacterium]|nr:tetratricopeptide repeat protein [Bacteroidales bacterium]MDD3891270.1 tetratricopeptide repeat protein [Bacteroidales bacterium]